MEGSYKFFRMRQGIASFAEMSVRAVPNDTMIIDWPKKLDPPMSTYADAITWGIALAYQQHQHFGGMPARIEVVEIVEVPVDTKADAVTCAAAVATWLALGHDESEIAFEFKGGWTVSFDGPSVL